MAKWDKINKDRINESKLDQISQNKMRGYK